ncbi:MULTISPECIES: glycerophosphodiester phosphodiesterase [Streptomyces]|uniref:Glycerophosphodiester phosphodiesterase family protein n=1 Tax=Streptomyces chilikensis TaxID=1194079 RepID=A0ABV3EUI6_9ACTN|nr:glycerophosphodiester phosphodiesterase family protein [Streptomyces sp. MJP52]MDH6227509.1 glycerophosphoryl diester phosphodiesterase [Streptomyces sp. MJP52]
MHARAVAASASALLGLVALLLPTSGARADHEAVRPAVIAHRGASALAPENTLAAVDRAHRLGFTWVENDVQRTRDGVLVVLHDAGLARTTDVERVFPGRSPWRVRDFTAAEIARLDAGGWFGRRFAGARVPTLRQYLARVERNRQSLLLEIKNPRLYPGIGGQVLDELDRAGWLDRRHRSRLVIQSFDAPTIRTVHRLRPAVRTAVLGAPTVAELREYARFADQINPRYTKLTVGYVAAAQRLRGPHGRPVEVCAWTVDRPVDALIAAGHGVDCLITNRPDVVRRALSVFWTSLP